jgi:NAD(P)H-flavin reductase
MIADCGFGMAHRVTNRLLTRAVPYRPNRVTNRLLTRAAPYRPKSAIRNPQSAIIMFPVNLSVTRVNKHTRTVWSFFMVPRNGPRPEFRAGQVAILSQDHSRGGAGDYNDTYIAFASAPEEDEFEFLIKHVPEPPGLSGALFDPSVEKKVVLKNIVGCGFPVEDHKGHDLVFVAMGIGLAPLRSTLRHLLLSRKDYGRLVVLYGARTVEDFCFEDEMATEWREQGIELRQVISQPKSDWSGPTGYVQSLLDNIVPELNFPVALVCGSREMIGQTRVQLLDLGFAPEKILTNY